MKAALIQQFNWSLCSKGHSAGEPMAKPAHAQLSTEWQVKHLIIIFADKL
jgi:hypothetical protein